MQCKCGGMTSDHKVVRDKETVGEYARCTSCGYVSWIWKHDDYEKIVNKTCNTV